MVYGFLENSIWPSPFAVVLTLLVLITGGLLGYLSTRFHERRKAKMLWSAVIIYLLDSYVAALLIMLSSGQNQSLGDILFGSMMLGVAGAVFFGGFTVFPLLVIFTLVLEKWLSNSNQEYSKAQ